LIELKTSHHQAFVVNKKLDTQALLVFQGLRRFYKAVNVVSSLIGGLSFAVLTFSEFHPTDSSRVFEGFLCSSAMAASVINAHSLGAHPMVESGRRLVLREQISSISVVLSTMLHFTFEGGETAAHRNLVIAWSS
jgi:hypothetical protein